MGLFRNGRGIAIRNVKAIINIGKFRDQRRGIFIEKRRKFGGTALN